MVSQSVEKILAAESRSADTETSAAQDARRIIGEAKEEAQKIAEEYRVRANEDSAALIKKAQKNAELTVKKATADAEVEAAEFKKKAIAKMPDAVEAVIKILTE